MVALAKMVGFYEGKLLRKDTARISDWERDPLEPDQIECSFSYILRGEISLTCGLLDAANDVDCAVRMYKKICGIAEKAEKTLTFSKYTTDLKRDYDSGKLRMITTVFTVPTAKKNLPPHVIQELTPQEFKAYTLWHKEGRTLTEVCVALRSKDNPLKESTVMWVDFVTRQLL